MRRTAGLHLANLTVLEDCQDRRRCRGELPIDLAPAVLSGCGVPIKS